MAFINNVEIHHVKCNPKYPNDFFNKENPTWEVQVRLYDRARVREFEEMNIPLKAIIPDPEKDGPDAKPYWKTILRKSSRKKDGTEAKHVEVLDGNLNPVDPDTIGNGSMANLRIFQYTYPVGETTKTATMLMGLQLTTHKLYTPKRENFAQVETKIIAETPQQMPDSDVDPDLAADEAALKVPGVPGAPKVDPNAVF
jgi:hypothetical protein